MTIQQQYRLLGVLGIVFSLACASACLFAQKPVCPSSNPRCTSDDDAVIWQGATRDAGSAADR